MVETKVARQPVRALDEMKNDVRPRRAGIVSAVSPIIQINETKPTPNTP